MTIRQDDRPLALLDRDGTIIVDRHYLADPAELELLPGAAEGLRNLATAGYRLAIITNQSGVARGYFTYAVMSKINDRLVAMLAAEDVHIEAVASCPHAPGDDCSCRKPRPGQAHEVVRVTGASLEGAVVIGDKASDIGLAHAIGARGLLVARDAEAVPECGQTATVRDLLEAAAFLTGQT